jgi:hypothetical protein
VREGKRGVGLVTQHVDDCQCAPETCIKPAERSNEQHNNSLQPRTVLALLERAPPVGQPLLRLPELGAARVQLLF